MKPAKKISPPAKAATRPKKKAASVTPAPRKRRDAAPAKPPPPVTDMDIATCAYFIYVNEGCPAGREMDHWLQAEARLRGR